MNKMELETIERLRRKFFTETGLTAPSYSEDSAHIKEYLVWLDEYKNRILTEVFDNEFLAKEE